MSRRVMPVARARWSATRRGVRASGNENPEGQLTWSLTYLTCPITQNRPFLGVYDGLRAGNPKFAVESSTQGMTAMRRGGGIVGPLSFLEVTC